MKLVTFKSESRTVFLAVTICILGLSLPSLAFEPDKYFENLKALCGARFEGEMTFPLSGQDSFAGKRLVASFDQCEENELRIPFSVGENHSRTWIFNRGKDGLQLKHDHRHEDGTPDEVTMYGGMANNAGSSLSQSFEADQYTAKLIPAAATNVWTVSLDSSGQILTYHLERNAAPRFTAVLTRVEDKSRD